MEPLGLSSRFYYSLVVSEELEHLCITFLALVSPFVKTPRGWDQSDNTVGKVLD